MGTGTSSLVTKIIPGFSIIVIFSFFIMIQMPHAIAQTDYEFNEIKGSAIASDPMAQKILGQIELSKKILAEMQSGTSIGLTEHQKFIAEQRKIAQEKLDAELQRMNKKYEAYTPKNAFASYVSDKPEYMQEFYWDQFNYLNNKVNQAKQQRDLVMKNGGSFYQAQQVFIQHATFPKSEVQTVHSQLVEKHNLYDHYAGELDSDKWYPEEAVQMFESWSKNADRYLIEPPTQTAAVKVETQNDTVQKISFDLATQINPTPKPVSVRALDSSKTVSTAMTLYGNNYKQIDGEILNGATEFTVSAWVNPDYKKGSPTFTILEKPGVFKLSINNYVEPKHIVKFSVFDGIRWNTVQSFSVINSEWTHVAGVFDDSGLAVYVNGNLEGMYQMRGMLSLNERGVIEESPLVIGDSPQSINVGVQKIIKLDETKEKNYFSGLIDDVLVENKALSIAEFYDNKSI